jgi:hypothetical protein
MNWTNLPYYYGFRRPYNFRAAIPLVLNLLSLLLVFIVCAFLFTNGELTTGTQRFYFFIYVAILLCVAAVASRATMFSLAILLWCAIELGLALSSSVLEKYLAGTSLLPRNDLSEPVSTAYVYHPLLQGAPKPNWRETNHVDVSAETRAKFPEVNWSEINGRDFTLSHNSLGLRGFEPKKNDLEKDLIFVYGGSTTYDLGVTQGSTWIERLQSNLGNQFTLLNFGVPGYSTTEHLIQTAFYQNIVGKKPVCAIYYIGWNDIHNAHIRSLDGAYADWHLLTQIDALSVRKPVISAAKYSPLLRLAYEKTKHRFDTIPQAQQMLGKSTVQGSDQRLEALFIDHVNTITSVNTSRGIRTAFIGQILNRDKLKSDGVYGFLPLVRDKDVWVLQARFNQILERAALLNGSKYIDAGIDNFRDSDFVDNGHFSASGSEKFARLISKRVGEFCH